MKPPTIAIISAIAVGLIYWFWPRKSYANSPRLPLPPGTLQPPLEPYGPPDDARYYEPPKSIKQITDSFLRDTSMPRGIRNHNPMNLRYVSSIKWDGQIGPDDAGYARFDTVEYGIRAGVKNLLNGYFKRGLDTPREIISRYAPSHENPTDNYIQFIADQMGISKDAIIEPTKANLTRLATAIIAFENGVQPYAETTIARGVKMAFDG